MAINIYNASNKSILVCVGLDNYVRIEPHSNSSLFCSQKEEVNISVKLDEKSHIEKGKFVLLIQTKYCFTDSFDSMSFSVAREKIRVGPDMYFERLFLVPEEPLCYKEFYDVPDEKEAKKLFNKKRRNYFLIRPLEYFTGVVLIILIVGLFLIKRIGLINIILYCFLAYVLLICMSWLVDWFWNTVFKKGFKDKSDKEAFYACLDNEFISDYYSNPARAPFLGEIEREGF